MIEFKVITKIDSDVFSALFAKSLPSLDSGSFCWDNYPDAISVVQKEALYLSFFNKIAGEVGGILWAVMIDGKCVMYNAGTKEGHRVMWRLALVGRDENNSASFFYCRDYVRAEKAFWTSLGVTSHIAQIVAPDTPIYRHYLNRAADGKMSYPIFCRQYPAGAPYYGAIEVLVGFPRPGEQGFVPLLS